MAQRVQVVLVDDLDGGAADETVSFALDGSSYEIDLSAAHAGQLREALAPYLGHARKAARASARPTRSRSRSRAGGRSAQIRAWARERGLPVNERGRIPADLAEQYDAAH
jgi:hypothetical protein